MLSHFNYITLKCLEWSKKKNTFKVHYGEKNQEQTTELCPGKIVETL